MQWCWVHIWQLSKCMIWCGWNEIFRRDEMRCNVMTFSIACYLLTLKSSHSNDNWKSCWIRKCFYLVLVIFPSHLWSFLMLGRIKWKTTNFFVLARNGTPTLIKHMANNKLNWFGNNNIHKIIWKFRRVFVFAGQRHKHKNLLLWIVLYCVNRRDNYQSSTQTHTTRTQKTVLIFSSVFMFFSFYPFLFCLCWYLWCNFILIIFFCIFRCTLFVHFTAFAFWFHAPKSRYWW